MTATRRVTGYFGLLAIVGGLADPNGGLVQLPLLFLLKDELRQTPSWIAWFVALVSIPGHLGVLFGALRDRWRPRGIGDRAYFLTVAVVSSGAYLFLAGAPPTVGRLLSGALALAVAFQLFDASAGALLAIAARRHLMSGRLNASVEIADNSVSLLAMLAGGWLAGHAAPQTTFAIAAAVSSLVAVFGVWAPREIFDGGTVHAADAGGAGWRRLLSTRRFWTVLALLGLFSFSPGWGTPFLFYLTGKIAISNEAFGVCRAASFAAVAAATALYGRLCTRIPLRDLLWPAILLNVLPGFLFLLVVNVPTAVVTAALAGLCSGFGTIALLDLLTRACPRRLEGTASMLGVSALGLSWSTGDVTGAWLYEQGGFLLCIVVDAVATVAMLPLFLRLPPALIAHADGTPPAHDAGIVVP